MKKNVKKTQKKNTKENDGKRNKAKVAFNCIFGTLALLGSAGTITFGTLWCHNRGGGGSTTETITITFDKIGDEYIIEGLPSGQTSMEVLANTTYGMLPTPKKDGKDFGGWMVNSELKNPSDIITSNTTIEPKWTEADTPVTIKLDTVTSIDTESCILSATDYTINKDQKKEIVAKMSDVVTEELVKTYGCAEYYLFIAPDDVTASPLFHWDCEFYIDDQLISPDSYWFNIQMTGSDTPNLMTNDPSVMEKINVDTSILRVLITPYEDIPSNVNFMSLFRFNLEP